jgi:hypothetical protein
MANVTIKAEEVIDAAELSLSREVVLPKLCWTDLTKQNFVGAKDDTVTLRLPAVATGTKRALRSTDDVTFNELTEHSVDVTLSYDVSVDLKASLVEQTLDLIPFSQRFVVPATKAQALAVEDVIAEALDDATPTTTVDWDGTASNVKAALIAASKALNVGNVSKTNRTCLVGANAFAEFLDYASTVTGMVSSTVADTAVQEATVGRLFGFNIVSSNAIDADAVYAMSPYAIAFIGIPPTIPAGAVDGAQGSTDGIGFSIIQDYDPVKRSDRLSVQTYVGATSVEINDVNPFLVRIGDFS